MAEDESFSIGSAVRAKSFRGLATVLEGPNRRGEYLVGLGAVQLWVPGTELRAAPPNEKSKTRERAEKLLSGLSSTSGSRKVLRIDLHGQTAREAKENLERAIDRALVENATGVEIIHGLGSGILKAMVHRYLESSPHIGTFKLDENNPGTTWAYF